MTAGKAGFSMNLPFFKVRVATCPWIVFDRTAAALGNGEAQDRSDDYWSDMAVGTCDRTRGAAAEGLVVISGDEGADSLRFWNREGRAVEPLPGALLCASRLIFDAGRVGSDIVKLSTSSGDAEVLVIDSRNFGIAVGEPTREDGLVLSAASVAGGLGRPARSGVGVMVPVRFGARTVEVSLFDAPPAKAARTRTQRSRSIPRVEALVVSRSELRVRRGACDPVLAAAAAVVAAATADYAERDATVITGGSGLIVQWPEGEPVFVAAAPEYCFSGEFWTIGAQT
ncbi:MAG: hypothetical protein JXM71_08850 [Spirochaetales bacterium]|nr:hypothetical protein [Spirochaetales bacterium]